MSRHARFCSSCGAPAERTQIADVVVEASASDTLLQALRQATVGQYEIIGELGQGGMATVYRAHDLALDRQVAIKLMMPELRATPGMAERFMREARTSAQLSHPHIIPIYAVKEVEDLLFFVMKYIQGRDLDSVLAGGNPLSISVMQTILGQVGSALAYAADQGVVHRDIKPANIILDNDGWAIVTDFGIAKVAEAQGLTQTGGTVGTPTYMSPEQCKGTEVTGASDQYSLGIVAYEMLSGKLPFDTDTVMSTMWAHVNEPPKDLREVYPTCPTAIARAVMRMLEKRPQDRWPSVADAVAAIRTGSTDTEHQNRDDMATLANSEDEGNWVSRYKTPASPVPPSRPAVAASSSSVGPAALELSVRDGTLTPGESVRLEARAVRADGSLMEDVPIKWTSSLPNIARVAEEGVVTAVTIGSSIITAEHDGKQTSMTVRVTRVGATEVRVTSPRQTLPVGAEVQLEAEAFDRFGETLVDRFIQWSSTHPDIAEVSPTGIVTGREHGVVEIVAKSGSCSASVRLKVSALELAGITVTPTRAHLKVGESRSFAAVVQERSGIAVPGVEIEWASSDPGVAEVSPEGVVTGHRYGLAMIAAICKGKRGTARVSVTSHMA